MAVVDPQTILNNIIYFLMVAAGLSFVIFVHELGHFLVAKACGVKCEKFYIGFDVPMKLGPIQLPSRLGRFQWGETEYGIGILPLGGYVKMLGQDDDPRNAQLEADRIRIKKHAADAAETEAATAGSELASPLATDGGAAGDEDFELDPRSFPAKPVPHRMAIISAGVIMNLIFAVLFATYAFRVGVPFTPTEVGGMVAGSPAWRAGLEPGSRIIQIGENGRRSEKLRFDWDLRNGGVGLAQDKEDLQLLVRLPNGEEKPYQIRPVLASAGGSTIPMIGVAQARTLIVGKALPYSSSDETGLQPSDKIVSVDGEPVADVYEYDRILARHPDKELKFKLERPSDQSDGSPQTVEVSVPPNQIKGLGLEMRFGPLSAIRPGSPAEKAGLQVGDVLESIQGEPVGDALLLPALVRPYYGQEMNVQVRRDGETVEMQVVPEQPEVLDWTTLGTGFPMSVEALGIAFPITSTVRSIRDGAGTAGGLQPGDTITAVSFRSENPDDRAKKLFNGGKEIKLGDDGYDWIFVFEMLQFLSKDAIVTLHYERSGSQHRAELKPVVYQQTMPERGIRLKLKKEIYTADSWSDAFVQGYRQTREDALRVVTFVKKLATREISFTKVGGPLTIIYVAGTEASQGIPRLLLFFTFLSANLAVLNFLPIPALDGGHMLFLIAEGIRGKPVDERMQVALTLAGVVCLLGLMIFVFWLDIQRLSGLVFS